jgi:hypothetical protein
LWSFSPINTFGRLRHSQIRAGYCARMRRTEVRPICNLTPAAETRQSRTCFWNRHPLRLRRGGHQGDDGRSYERRPTFSALRLNNRCSPIKTRSLFLVLAVSLAGSTATKVQLGSPGSVIVSARSSLPMGISHPARQPAYRAFSTSLASSVQADSQRANHWWRGASLPRGTVQGHHHQPAP